MIPAHAWPSLVLLAALAELMLASPPLAAAGIPARPPNVIVILADDLGYADLSCYGNDRYTTPHLDALARNGVRFTDFHSNGPVCSPTRAALLTGRYQQRAGIDEVVLADPKLGMRDTQGLNPAELTFAKLLKQAGYQTGIMGKWHLGYDLKFNPTHLGFDEFRGYLSGNVDFHSHIDGAGFPDWWHNRELKDEPGYTTHLITRHAVQFIEKNRAQPFCLYIAHEAPHAPFQGPGDPPVRGPHAQKALSGADLQRAYREMVQEMDQGVGEIVATLERLGLAENTLNIFTSDNGATREGNNGPLRGLKGSVWEGGHRVPAIACWPGRIRPGTVTTATTLSMDLAPTLAELAGATLPPGHYFDGKSLLPLLLKQTPLAERTLFWGYNDRYAVRRGPWKLIINPPPDAPVKRARKTEPNEPLLGLYQLDEDPRESHNVASAHPELVRELSAALAAWKDSVAPSR